LVCFLASAAFLRLPFERFFGLLFIEFFPPFNERLLYTKRAAKGSPAPRRRKFVESAFSLYTRTVTPGGSPP